MSSSDEEHSKPLNKNVPRNSGRSRPRFRGRVDTSSKCFIGIVVAFVLVLIIALVLGLTLGLRSTDAPIDLPAPLNWYQNGTIYRIYIPSFGDTDGNGIGDFAGIEQHLNYLKELGVTILWLSPIQETNTFGYDVTDFMKTKDDYGNLDSFRSLLNSTKSLGMKVIMDIIINHSSRAHDWFQKSKVLEAPYTDFYVWNDGLKEDSQPPNNWVSVYNKSAWSRVEEKEVRVEYYLHQFRPNEPDLNYRNPQVVAEMKKFINFWLDQGIDGFYIRDVPLLFEDEGLRDDEPIFQNAYMGASPDDYVSYKHNYTRDLSKSYEIIQELFVSTASLQRQIVLMADLTDKMASEDKWVQMYQLVTSSSLYQLDAKFNGRQLKLAVEQLAHVCNKTQVWPAWTLGNEENSRINSKFGRLAPGLQVVQLLLPGIKSIYYGEEIEMADHFSISFDDTRDPVAKEAGQRNYSLVSKDPFHTPMLWNASRHSGFSSANKPWLPMTNGNTADSQQKRSNSLWNSIATLNRLKNSSIALSYGSIDFPYVDDNIFSFSRTHASDPVGYLIVWNLGSRMEKVPLDQVAYIPDELKVIRKIKHDSSITEPVVVRKSDLSVEREEIWVITFQKRK